MYLSDLPIYLIRATHRRFDFFVSDGAAPPGCCVLSATGRACKKRGKIRTVSCIHEHACPPAEICDTCADLISQYDCGPCATTARMFHSGCKLFVMLASS